MAAWPVSPKSSATWSTTCSGMPSLTKTSSLPSTRRVTRSRSGKFQSGATGVSLKWPPAREPVAQTRLDQDHMLDFLRREDAPELPEVGLQAAATRLSQVLLQKLARAEDPETHIDNYSKLEFLEE